MDVAVLGPDGLDPGLVNRWKDDLPTLRDLTDNGSGGRLRSSHPPLTSPAWPTMYTGKQGGKHGVFGFTKREQGSYERRAINYSDVKAESLWDALESEGYSCGVVNVPLTYPPSDLENGFVISGWPAPRNADLASDDLLLEQVEEAIGEPYDPNPFPPVAEYDHIEDEKLYEEIESGLDHHGRVFEELIKKRGDELDVFFGVFSATDVIGHAFAWDKEYMKRLYVRMDEILEDLIDMMGPDTDVVLLSDHGHGVEGAYRFYINDWLKQNGFLNQTDYFTSDSLFKRTGITVENLLRLQNRLGLRNAHEYLPDFLHERLSNMIPEDSETEGDFIPDVVDWGETEAYSPQQNVLTINGKNKPSGTVEEDERDRLVDTLVAELEDIDHPDPDIERQLISEIRTKDEIFDGPFYEDAPDIVFIADEMRCNAPMGFKGQVFAEERWGEHHKYGVLMTDGPSFADVDATHKESIVDVFPLILALVGASIPENVDGDIPFERLVDDVDVTFRESDDDLEGDKGYSDEESQDVEEQLKGLGYLE